MALTDIIYKFLPVSLQNYAISLYGYKWQKRRFGGIFEKELTGFKAREKYTPEQWEVYQNAELRNILTHAFSHVPFYRKKFTDSGFTLNDLENFNLSDLSRLPYLEKDELRTFGTTDLIASTKEPGGDFFASSGSTGTPTQILISPRMHQAWSAGFEARIRHWAGVNRKTPRGTIGGRRIIKDGDAKGPFYRYNLVEKQVYFSAYHISPKTVANYVDGMFKHNIEYMTGYAMSNYFLARFIEEAGIKAPQLKAVITSSEKLTPEMRETFRRVYGCPTFDSYSGVEDCGMITECESGSLHISPDLGIIEILNEQGKPVNPGEEGEAVCTGTLNYDQPLIRYRIGDMLRLGKNQNCPCGRQMPVIDEIIGRIEDTVVGKDGREMVRFHGIFINIPEIIEAQLIQHTLDMFEIKLVTSQQLNPDQLGLIQSRMESQLGKINLEINEVESIPRNQNGKFKAVVSKVKRNTI